MDEKYKKLIGEGKSDNEAFELTVESYKYFIQAIKDKKIVDSNAQIISEEELVIEKKRMAKYTAISIALYIISTVVYLLFEDNEKLSLFAFLV